MSVALARLAALVAAAVTAPGALIAAPAAAATAPDRLLATPMLFPQDQMCWESMPWESVPPSVSTAQPATTACPVTIRVMPVPTTPVTVWFRTQAGTARPQVDYVHVAEAPVTIPPGASEGTAVVQILSDREQEPDETFSVVLIGASGAVIADPVAVVTIKNGTAPPGG